MEAFGGYLVDEKAVTVESAFLDFLKSFRSGQHNELYYDHVIRFSDLLQKAISDEFLRFEPHLQNACKRFVMELKPTFISDDNPNKDINVAFYNIPIVKRGGNEPSRSSGAYGLAYHRLGPSLYHLEEATTEVSQIKAIIEILIRREGHLIVVDDGREAAAEAAGAEQSASASRNDRILAVAPNYVAD